MGRTISLVKPVNLRKDSAAQRRAWAVEVQIRSDREWSLAQLPAVELAGIYNPAAGWDRPLVSYDV